MKVTTEPRDNRQIALTIEVEPERVEAALAKAAKSIAQKAHIPGFRKGKAPRHIIEQMFGKGALLEEALDDLGQQVYREALEQENIEPYGPGQMEDFQAEPNLVLKMIVSLAPTVDVGDYRSLRVPFEEPPVEDHEIDHQLAHLRERHAIIEPAAEGTALDWGYVATIDLHSTVEGKPFFNREDASIVMEKERLDDTVQVLPGFEEQLIGLKAGDEKSFSLGVPNEQDEYGEFAGKTAEFEVTVKEVRLRTLPELDDALAQTVGDFETIDALRDAIRKDIADAKKREAESAYIDKVIERLLNTAQIEFPPLIVEEELDAMLERTDKRLRDQKLTLDEYLKVLGKTRDEYRAEMRPTAEARIRHSLLLTRIVELENLRVDASEVDRRIEATGAAYGQRAQDVIRTLSTKDGKRRLEIELLTQKALHRLAAIARGEAPEPIQPEIQSE
ncbi:MAG TPA: trigger factor [Anaerolineae bacterium]